MKAIKLASIFAVTAVAAAVSTTTMAAEPVFYGNAGVEYVANGDGGVNSLSGTNDAEVEISVDTGVVYAEIEIATDNNSDEDVDIGLEKLYVKQGDVSFGRFDGTVATGSFMGYDEYFGGVDLKTSTDTDSTGIRYKATPELTLAIEATESTTTEDSDIGVAASYVMDFDGFKAGISGGVVGDSNAFNIGAQTVAGPATLSLNYGAGEQGATGATDVELMTASVALAASEDLTITLEYSADLETENGGTYLLAQYVVGDLTYYVENYAGDLATQEGVKATKIGVLAYF